MNEENPHDFSWTEVSKQIKEAKEILKMNKWTAIILGFPTVFSILLFGCASPDVSDVKINDRVKACSGGFSEGIQSSLNASLNKNALEGGVHADFKQEARSLIFSELPESDRLRGYEDYLKCVETNWNKEEK